MDTKARLKEVLFDVVIHKVPAESSAAMSQEKLTPHNAAAFENGGTAMALSWLKNPGHSKTGSIVVGFDKPRLPTT